MDNVWASRAAQDDFRDARRQAFISSLIDIFRGRTSRMVSLEDIRSRLHVRGQRYLGVQSVLLDNVIGSEGRYDDFDRRFLPRSNSLKGRWSSIDRAMIQLVELPPIEVYKISETYFVRDGNHRVSVARQRGQSFIDAYVTELIVDVPLNPDLSMHDLMLTEEYSDFLAWTGLGEIRPDQRIHFSELGGYLELVKHVNAHRYYMGLEQETEISRDEAVADWYDNVYMPIVEVIHQQDVLRYFPERTEADLYRWIMDHRWYMREHIGADPGPESATSDYVSLFGRKGLNAIGEMLRSSFQKLSTRP
ncbi:MAG: DUF4032 domain-containing protein [Chloroflexi bacterium AL-W]|nr:DUF4032 domain-containing protein [Chloroflexi bacterium AL-N1]NOK71424.1 DUF4032 domain-containing protein [Chloroflexi bacterium AL-N10]NOK78827.1 DUF4032 domain-containing protein [Chloroflexi bacterium AL-N5]NOK86245.1 DUF4032 domain-containing protein [Chloroflexi bacterium AL-W]NOK93149.1 DUF4032 domain-containing protein [Chloroflexi bacterium AL-N15]